MIHCHATMQVSRPFLFSFLFSFGINLLSAQDYAFVIERLKSAPTLLQRIFLLFLVCSLSQAYEAQAQKDERYWSDRKLEWTDFKGIPRRGVGSQLKYIQGYETGKQKYHDTTVVRLVAYVYMDMNASWVNPDSKTDLLLRYNQTLFDLLEIGRRSMQEGLDAARTKSGIDDTFKYYTQRNDILVEEFSAASEDGRDSATVEAWRTVVQEQLAVEKEHAMPRFIPRNFKYGIHLSFGYTSFLGSLPSYITPAPSMNYGFDLGFKKSLLILDVVLGGTKTKKEVEMEGSTRSKGKGLGYVMLNMAYGYRVIDNSNWRFYPYVGAAFTELSYRQEEKPYSIHDFNISTGLDLEYKFWKKINLTPGDMWGTREASDLGIRFRLFLAKTMFSADLMGTALGASIGFYGFGSFVK